MTPEDHAAYDALYEGKKADVRPVGDALLAAAQELGGAVRIVVTERHVALAGEQGEFAVFLPSSGRRVTLRLRLLGTVEQTGRFESTAKRAPEGRFDMRAYLAHPDHVDAEVRALMRRARDLAR